MMLIVREDLGMSVGKTGAQCAHAAVGLVQKLTARFQHTRNDRQRTDVPRAAALRAGISFSCIQHWLRLRFRALNDVLSPPLLPRNFLQGHPLMKQWEAFGQAKIALKCKDLDEMIQIAKKARRLPPAAARAAAAAAHAHRRQQKMLLRRCSIVREGPFTTDMPCTLPHGPQAEAAGLPIYVVHDAGRTEVRTSPTCRRHAPPSSVGCL